MESFYDIRQHLENPHTGFVDNFRDGKNMAIVLKDISGKVQITVKKRAWST